MSKEMILLADVDGLGVQGDIVKVKDGFARNFLVPQKKGAPLTTLAQRQIEKRQKEREERMAADREKAEKLVATLEKLTLKISVKAGEDGKLFGSVQAADIAHALEGHGVQVQKSQVRLKEAIKRTGSFQVTIKLHPEVSSTVKVVIVEE